MPSLNPGTASAGSTSVVIPAGTAPGSYFLIANADADGSVPESNENNNVRTKALTILAPDLTVTALSAPTVSGANRTISITETTRNATGVSAAPPSTTSYYLSTDAVWDAGDILFGSRDVPALTAGAIQSTLTASYTLPTVAGGNYVIIAKADGPLAIAESNEANNTRVLAIKIGPDLSVTALAAPAKSGAGLSVTATDTTANAAGRSDVTNSTTSFYLSSDTVLGGDTLVGSRSTGAIASGSNSPGSATVTIPAGTTTGTWYIIAKADGPDVLFETSETNNTRNFAIKIGPDLTVSAIAAPVSAHPGRPTISVKPTTLNSGGGSTGSGSLTKIYLRNFGRFRHVPGNAKRADPGAERLKRRRGVGDDSRGYADGELQHRGGGGRRQRDSGNDRDEQHEDEGHHDQLTGSEAGDDPGRPEVPRFLLRKAARSTARREAGRTS